MADWRKAIFWLNFEKQTRNVSIEITSTYTYQDIASSDVTDALLIASYWRDNSQRGLLYAAARIEAE